MAHYEESAKKTFHPLNLPIKRRFIPDPLLTDKQSSKVRNLSKLTAKSCLDKVYLKHKDKVKKTLFYINRKTVVFQYEDLVFQSKFESEKELREWINIQLLKYVGVTLDLYILFFHSYKRKIKLKDGSDYWCWKSVGK